ncbi:ribosome maturation factor RimM [Skermania piniformis]|uniref:Ribosome maturation factor RimM n=1 Tax=Skermania pinensis TaxID=39122 RepID=A0ABX8S4D7_9ACTN|nr:ribosome maturation factor RimM [Skermania piniformis]QXQ12699.1 ribosome maturation factor RimM [Skermania piniformis]
MELAVGRVVKAHGVRGELVVEVRTDEPERRFAPGGRLRGRDRLGRERSYTVESCRAHSGRLLVQLAEIADRTAADAVRGTVFVIDSADLPPSDDPEEFYDHELEGLQVELLDGSVIGTVAEVLHSAAGELLAVTAADDGREILIPFVTELVPTVSLAERRIVVDPPDGLL